MEVTQIEKPSVDCPIDEVTVYVDRAEVTRVIQLELTKCGMHEVVLKGLPDSVDENSVRVKGGVGNFTIVEVSYETHYIQEKREPDESEVGKLRSRQDAIDCELQDILHREQWIDQQRKSIRTYGTEAVATPVPASVEAMTNILSFCMGQEESLDNESMQLTQKSRELQKERAAVAAKITSLVGSRGVVTTVSRDVTCAIDVEKEGTIDMYLTYLVRNASWSPSYDVRVSSKDSKLELTYFGEVRQSTGEAWKDVDLRLSTAAPSKAGEPPSLPTKRVQFAVQRRMMAKKKSKEILPQRMMMNYQAAAAFECEEDDEEDMAGEAEVAMATVETAGAGTASIFEIPRATTIMSNNQPHKVTITTVAFPSQFVYYSAPELASAAFLQSKTKNASDFSLLASDKVSIFLDGNFVANGSMKNVSPGESFNTFLGEDPSVKVTYRPVKTMHSIKGTLMKSESKTYEHSVSVKNTKPLPIKVALAHHLPRSTDSTITVTLLQPKPEEVGKASVGDLEEVGMDGERPTGIRQHEVTNNLIWTQCIAAGKEISIPLKYSIDYRVNETIQIV